MLIANSRSIDPTRTTLLRRQWENELVGRFKLIQQAIAHLIVEQNALGIITNYDPSEARDSYGRWTASGTLFKEHKITKKIHKLFGSEHNIKSISALAGPQEGAHVSIKKAPFGINALTLETKHKDYESNTDVYPDHLHLAWFKVFNPGNGLGTKVLHDQVKAASNLGLKHIELQAAGQAKPYGLVGRFLERRLFGGRLNGYYTWARLGFDANLSDNDELQPFTKEEQGFLDKHKAKRVSDLMKTKEGREWWKNVGGRDMDLQFDLTPGSQSHRALNAAYRAVKRREAFANNEEQSIVDNPDQAPESDDLTLEEDQALDDFWDNANQTTNTRWAYQTDAEKLKQFKVWLQIQINQHILSQRQADSWLTDYVSKAYAKGLSRSFEDVRSLDKSRAYYDKKLDFYNGTRAEFLSSSFGRPVSLNRIELLGSRTYSELKGVTDAMSQQMTRTLVDGMAQGISPREVAVNLNKDVAGIGMVRSRMIARTETIRAHAEGQLDALEALGVTHVGVAVEFATAGDFKVCAKCSRLNGSVLTISQARSLIPLHPNCRCAWQPQTQVQPLSPKLARSRIASALRAIAAQPPRKRLYGPARGLQRQRFITPKLPKQPTGK